MALHTDCGDQPSADLHGISLCAGYGGLDLGITIAEPRYRTVCFVEREAHAATTLVARMDDAALDHALVWDDLRSFDGQPWRDRIHILSAGYPCQPFSNAGKRRGEADPRHLWPEVERIIGEVRPCAVFAENVEGHIDLGFAEVHDSLSRLGYRTKAGLFTAREAGASHRRRRLFILAYADGDGCGLYAGPDDPGWPDPAEIPLRQGGDQFGPVFTEQHGAGLDQAVADHASDRLGADDAAPLFAPGPGELSVWHQLLHRRPDLQPAILRAGYGLADRLDRTRGAGNGVCPLAAALAYRTLKAAHCADWLAGRGEL